MNKGIRNLYIFCATIIVSGILIIGISGKSHSANITPESASGSSGVAESYVNMTSTNPTWIRGRDGRVVQAGPLIFGNDKSTSSLAVTATCNNFSNQVPYYNSTGTTISAGSIVVIATYTSTGYPFGVTTLTLATTSIMGVAATDCPTLTVCNMIIGGYGLTFTTGPVVPGTLIVSTTAAAGYGAAATGTVAVGSVIGTALSVGNSAGGLTPVLIDKQ